MSVYVLPATADEPTTVAWSIGWSDCETCGGNSEDAEFYWDGEQWCGRISVGCFGGGSVETTEWADIQQWLDDWSHIKGAKKFAKAVKELFNG